MDYFSFLLIGTAFYGLLVAGVGYFISAIQEAQLTGTLELLMSTATPPSAVVLLSAFSVFAGRAVETAVYLVAGVLLFGVSFTHPNVPSALLIFVLSLVAIVALGVLASALQIAIQRGAAVTWLVSTAIAPFSGMMFPVSSLPAPLQKVAALVPIAYSIDGLRQSLVNGAGVALLAKPIFALVIFAAVLLPASFLALKYVLRKAQRDGTLSFY
jgi:ABC-2 type transport system permease protein